MGHLFFAVMTTVYMIVAIQFEERDLLRAYGERYSNYRRRVSMLVPLRFLKGEAEPAEIKPICQIHQELDFELSQKLR